jgi:hypothetical protein
LGWCQSGDLIDQDGNKIKEKWKKVSIKKKVKASSEEEMSHWKETFEHNKKPCRLYHAKYLRDISFTMFIIIN